MKFNRSSGIILHPTSLPGPYGIGDLGSQAHQWIDFLAEAGCGLWQILPLGPTGYGDSPYQCFSAFAGNFYLISPEALLADNLLKPDDLADLPKFPQESVDFGWVINWKINLLERSFQRFRQSRSMRIRMDYEAFTESHRDWLPDFAVFMALKEANHGSPWPTWAAPLRDREPEALAQATQQYELEIQAQMYRQFIFFRQWDRLREHAHRLGIQIIGDIPIFVAHDSADVWAHPELFYLDKTGRPRVVAGVPPDYFSPTGQLWGNPLYRWRAHRQTGYAWWLKRIRAVLETVDIIRIDHFRGFAGYWEVPGRAKNAVKGRWVKGPGKNFFQTVRENLGDLPIIAEDLGVITPDVVELRESFKLPGMKILQFGFGDGPLAPFLPHNYPVNCVVYTGSHDNDTVLGWYQRVGEKSVESDFYRRYTARDGSDVSWDLIREAWSSVAVFSLAPIQDFLSIDNQGRMNYPGNPSGNWTWRMPPDGLSDGLKARIKEINYLYARDKEKPTPPEPDYPKNYPGL
jgi:4-alpha-glucanotransferase